MKQQLGDFVANHPRKSLYTLFLYKYYILYILIPTLGSGAAHCNVDSQNLEM